MRKVFFLIIFFSPVIISQSDEFDFKSTQNIKLFADHLFCEGDYLRALEEYRSIRKILRNDTIDFKIMLCYSKIGLLQKIEKDLIPPLSLSEFKRDIKKLHLKNRFLNNPYSFYENYGMETYPFSEKDSSSINYLCKLISFSHLYSKLNFKPREEILAPFDEIEKEIVSAFFEWKINPPLKSEAVAGILSAIIPGSGKMYLDEWGDGITALLATGLFAFLAYDNFRANHNTRAWIFTGLGAFFYAGNVYGSIAAAQIFNAKISFEFEDGLNLYLEQNNYFLPEYNFCD